MDSRPALAVYAMAMIAAGVAWGWGAPLGPDEERYYLPAAKFFAARGVALDYPMPMPPFALVVQGFVYRLTESVYVLRLLSTVAAIGAAAVVATMTRSGWLLLMFGTFPAALLNAFSLKHHSLVLLACVAAFALWQRQRVALAALALALGALTHQITCAMVGTLVLLSLFERRYRDAAILSLSSLPLAALGFAWGGARPPLHEATFTGEPAMSGLQPAQIVVLLFMAGTWLTPAVMRVRWVVAAAALPFTAIWMHSAGLLRYSENVYGRLAGPVTSLIAGVTRGESMIAAILAGALAALGAALFWTAVAPATALTPGESGSYRWRSPELCFWGAMYALVMLAVPYFFESYYALFVAIGWVMLRKEIAARPPWFPIAATLAGIGYVVVKA